MVLTPKTKKLGFETEKLIENWYEVQRNLSLQVAGDFILKHLEQRVGLNAHSQIPVNA